MKNTARYLSLIALDLAIATTGAWLLWLNAGTTVVDGSIAGIITAMMASGVLLVIRQLIIGPRPSGGSRATLKARARTERVLSIVDIFILAGLFTAWLMTDNYLLGWIACFASAFLMLASGLQLMFEVTAGQSYASALPVNRSLLYRRLVASETLRLIAAAGGIAGIVLTTPIHQWHPSLINPLIIMLAIAIGCAGTINLLIGTRRSQRAQPEGDRMTA